MALPALIAASHGTADVGGASSIAALVAEVRARLTNVEVLEAFVDVQQPEVSTVVDAVTGPAVIVPLLLSRGFHVHHDLEGMARSRPNVVVAPPLGPDPALAEVLHERLVAAGVTGGPVIVAVAGSRDPGSEVDAEALRALLAERWQGEVSLAYLAAREPNLEASAASLPDATVSTYLLGRGFFFDRAVTLAGGLTVTPPLLDGGPTPQALVRLVIDRYREAARRFP